MRFRLDPADFNSCPQYNQWLDESHEEEHGHLEILSYEPRPSEVLFQMSPSTYTAAFSDFQTEYDEDLKRIVTEERGSLHRLLITIIGLRTAMRANFNASTFFVTHGRQ